MNILNKNRENFLSSQCLSKSLFFIQIHSPISGFFSSVFNEPEIKKIKLFIKTVILRSYQIYAF